MQGNASLARRVSALGLTTAMVLGMAAIAAVGDALAAPRAKTPSVTAVSPREGPTSGGTEVMVSGKNAPTCGFTLTGPICPKLMVYFGNEPGLVFESGKKGIKVFSPSQPAAGTVDVTVVTPAGTSAESSADLFTYNGPPAEIVPSEIPVVTAVEPNHGSHEGFNEVRIKGEHLTPNNSACVECNGDVVHFGPKNVAVSQGSSTELLVIAPPNTAGTVDVTVTTNPGGTSAMSASDHYTYE
jgi:hypothetical protein